MSTYAKLMAHKKTVDAKKKMQDELDAADTLNRFKKAYKKMCRTKPIGEFYVAIPVSEGESLGYNEICGYLKGKGWSDDTFSISAKSGHLCARFLLGSWYRTDD